MELEVKHTERKFFAQLEPGEANVTYEMVEQNVMDFQHTFVPEDFRGKGIAEKIAETALQYAREKKLKVIVTCRFMSSYLKRHQEYQDLLYQ